MTTAHHHGPPEPSPEEPPQPPEPHHRPHSESAPRLTRRFVLFWLGQWILNNALLLLTIIGILWMMGRIYRVNTTVNQMGQVLIHAPEAFKLQTEATLERLRAAHAQVADTARRAAEVKARVEVLARTLEQASGDTLAKLDVPAMQNYLAAAAESARLIAAGSERASATMEAALRVVPTLEARLSSAGKLSEDAQATVRRDLSLAASSAKDLADRMDRASTTLSASLAAVPTIEARLSSSAQRVAEVDASLALALDALPSAPKAGATAAASMRSAAMTAVGLEQTVDTQAAAIQKQLADLRAVLSNAATEANAVLADSKALRQEIAASRAALRSQPAPPKPASRPTPAPRATEDSSEPSSVPTPQN